jgi:hypothetical protein
MSLLMMMKEFVWGKNVSEASLPEDTEVTKILVYHDQWAAWTMHQVNQAYTEDLRRLLAIVEDCRQKKLDAVEAVVKRRALKIQHKAEREEDPAKMKKYMAKSEYAARYYQAKAKKLCGRRVVEKEDVLVLKEN